MDVGHSCTPALAQAELTQPFGFPSALSTPKCQGFRALLPPSWPRGPMTTRLAEWPVGTCLQGVQAPVLPQPGGRGSHKFTLPVACGINVSSAARFTSAPLAQKAEKTSLCVHSARRAGRAGWAAAGGRQGMAGPRPRAHRRCEDTDTLCGGTDMLIPEGEAVHPLHNRALMNCSVALAYAHTSEGGTACWGRSVGMPLGSTVVSLVLDLDPQRNQTEQREDRKVCVCVGMCFCVRIHGLMHAEVHVCLHVCAHVWHAFVHGVHMCWHARMHLCMCVHVFAVSPSPDTP